MFLPIPYISQRRCDHLLFTNIVLTLKDGLRARQGHSIMGSGEMDTPAKASKTSASQQEQPPTSTAAVYHDWTAFQAYYNSGTTPIPPHGFFPPSVASSPQAHPYIWGAQHLIPQYGTPPQYVAMYPHGGLYAHPSMSPAPHPFSPFAMPSPSGNAEASGPVLGGAEVDGKSSDGKERSPLKRSKGSLGSLNMLTGRNNNQMGKSLGVSDEVFSQSGESGSEESSEGSDANSQNDSQQKACSGQDSLEAEAGQNGSAVCSSQNGISCTPPQTMLNQTMAIMSAPGGVAGPTTNLNIGMDYWGGPTPSPVPALRGKVPATPVAGAMVPSGLVGRENTQSELWLQDERELKRLRRKQSNRESARRSRLRKQAECEELAQRVEVLKEENNALRLEVSRSRKEYEQLLSQNSSLKERLGEDPRGHNGDPRLDDDRQRCLDSDVQPGKMDPAQSGH